MDKKQTKRVIAGIVATALLVTGIVTAHYEAVRAADLTFIVTPAIPVADGESAGTVEKPQYNAANFTRETLSTYKYYYAGEPFSLLTVEDESATNLYLAQQASWGNSRWSSNNSGVDGTLIVEKTRDALNAKVQGFEKTVVKEHTVDTARVNNIGYRTGTQYPPTDLMYYPIAAGELYKVEKVDENKVVLPVIGDEDVLKLPATKFWTRTVAGENGAFYVDENGSLETNSKITSSNPPQSTSSDPDIITNEYAVIPAFRMDMTNDALMAEIRTDEESELPVSTVPYAYDYARNSQSLKYIIQDGSNNLESSQIANKDLTNVYKGGTLLIPYSLSDTSYTYVSVLIYDDAGLIKYYARLADADKRKGNAELDVPNDLIPGNSYTLALFAEKVGGVNDSIACTAPVYASFVLGADIPDDTPRKIATDEHISNFYEDTTGTVSYYLGEEEFMLGRINRDNSLMLIARDATKWSDAQAWDEEGLIDALNSKLTKFTTSEQNAIQPVTALFSKYDDGAQGSADLYLYPLTKSVINAVSENILNQNVDYWTGSYVNKNKAWYVNTSGALTQAQKTDNKYILPALDIKSDVVLAQTGASGENNANESTASEPGRYIPSDMGSNVRFIIIDDDDNKINVDVDTLSLMPNETIELDYSQATISADSIRINAPKAHYIDAVIYEKDKDNILYFGRLEKITTSAGSVVFKAPADIAEGEYDIAFVEETVYADKHSDTCSVPENNKVALTITKEIKKRENAPGTNDRTDPVLYPNYPDELISDGNIINKQFKEGDVIQFHTLSNEADENKFIVYNEADSANNPGNRLYVMMAAKNTPSTTKWTSETSTGAADNKTNGQKILTVADPLLETLSDVEDGNLIPTNINTNDRSKGGTGTANDKKLFVPSFSEISAVEEDVTDGAGNPMKAYRIPDNKRAILNTLDDNGASDIGNNAAETSNEAISYWTRTYAGRGNGYIISNGEYLNGEYDLNNNQYELKYIAGGYMDVAGTAMLIGDAEEGRYVDVNPVPNAYDITEYEGHAKPYYPVQDGRITLSVDAISQKYMNNAQPGATYVIPYSNATTGPNMYLSVIIYDINNDNAGSSSILYYGRLKRLTAGQEEGTFVLTLPEKSDKFQYLNGHGLTLSFFAEEANEPYSFNYTSLPILTAATLKSTKYIEFCDVEIGGTEWTGEKIIPEKVASVAPASGPYIEVRDPDTHELLEPEAYNVLYYKDEALTQKADEDGKSITEPALYYAKIYSTDENPLYPDGTAPAVKSFYVSKPLTEAGTQITISPLPENDKPHYTYNGTAITPNGVSVRDTEADKLLVENVDYELEYKDNVDATEHAKVVVKGMNAYSNTVNKEYPVFPATMRVISDNKVVTYDGNIHDIDIRPDETSIINYDASSVTITKQNGGTAFTGKTDAGSYDVNWKVTHPNYEDAVGTSNLLINRKDASAAVVTLEKDTYTYAGGSEIRPTIVSVSVDGLTVPAGSYQVTWANNTVPGQATGSVSFSKNFTGTKNDLSFTIEKLNLSTLLPSDLTVDPLEYTGNTLHPIIRMNGASQPITESEDFKFVFRKATGSTATGDDSDEVKAVGDYTVTIKPRNAALVEGEKQINFSVSKKVVTASNIVLPDTLNTSVYDGTAKDVITSVGVRMGTGNNASVVQLVNGVDYDITYDNNINAGDHIASITFKGNFDSQPSPYTVPFTITPGSISVRHIETIGGTTYDGTQKSPSFEFTPSKAEGTSVTYAVVSITDESQRNTPPAESAYKSSIGANELVNAGDYEVWYKATNAPNYEPLVGHTRVVIDPAQFTNDEITVSNINTRRDGNPHPFTRTGNITLSGRAATAVTRITYSETEDGTYTETIPTYEGEGAYTDIRVYDIYCKFEAPNYVTATRHGTVTITNAQMDYSFHLDGGDMQGTIVYDGNAHVITCVPGEPDAVVTYSTGSGAPSTTPPSFTNIGTHNVNVVITKPGFDDSILDASLTIEPAEMDVDVKGYSGEYDASSHCISIGFKKPSSSNATVTYSENGQDYTSEVPFKTNAGEYTIYYRITAANYNEKSGNVKINITAKDSAAEARGYDGAYDGQYHEPNITVTQPTSNYTITYSTDNKATWTTEKPKFKNPDTNVTVWWYLKENNDNYKPLSGNVIIKIGPKVNETIDENDIDKTKPIDEAVKEIVDHTDIPTIEIGPSIGQGITGEAFKDNENIRVITVDESNPYYSSKNGVLYDKNGDTVIAVPRGKVLDQDVVESILAGVTTVGQGAFENNSGLTGTLNIPNTVTTIKKDAFKNTGITMAVIPDSVELIESGAFADNRNLSIVTIAGDPVIEPGAFTGSGLSSVVYANNGHTIAYVPASVQVQDGVYSINSEVIEKIAGGALKDNTNIRTVLITGRNPVLIGRDAINSGVNIKVPASLVDTMKAQNPAYAQQITGYKMDISSAVIKLNEEGRIYKIGTDGTMPRPEISSVTLADARLLPNTDYKYDYTYDLAKGTITLTGTGNYEGTAVKQFQFTKTGQLIIDTISTMNGNTFLSKTGADSTLRTDKNALVNKLENSASSETKTLAKNKNVVMRMEYDENVDPSDKTKVNNYVDSSSNFSGVAKIFDISVYTEDEDGNKQIVSDLTSPVVFKVEIPGIYRNKAEYGVVRIHNGEAAEVPSNSTTTDTEFESDKFSTYALVYGEGTIDENLFTVSIPAYSYTYTGNPITPEVTAKYNSIPLALGTNYMVNYTNNVNEGTATITVAGLGEFAGIVKTINFQITGGGHPSHDISKVSVVLAGTTEYEYTGNPVKPSVFVLDDGYTMKLGKDYQVYYQNNIDAGAAKLIVLGINDYTGYRNEIPFSITKKSINSPDVKISGIEDQIKLDGDKPATMNPSLRFNGNKLKKGTDYRITYSNNKKAGTATMSIAGINNFDGVVEFDFDVLEGDKKDDKNNNNSSNNNNGQSGAAQAGKLISEAKLDKDGRIPVSVSGNMTLASGALKNTGKAAALSPQTNDISTVPVVLGIICIICAGTGSYILMRRKKRNR